MVSLEDYYEQVSVSFSSDSSGIRIKQLLDQVILGLPDEEQFGITGTILIGSREAMVHLYKKITSDPKFNFTPNMNSIRDGNYAFWFRGNLQDSAFLITIITDDLDEKSDNYIKGLIAFKLSEMSCGWKIMINTAPEELMNVLNQTGMNSPFGSKERENYERNVVDAETRRLGFSTELLAYDLGQ